MMDMAIDSIWSQPMRWPDDANMRLTKQGPAVRYTFFARAAEELGNHAPDAENHRQWACDRLIEAALDGNARLMLAYPSDDFCMELESYLLKAPEVAADFVRECGSVDGSERAWLFVRLDDVLQMLKKAAPPPSAGARRFGPAPLELNRLKVAIRSAGLSSVQSIDHAHILFGGARTTVAKALKEVREEVRSSSV